MTRCDMCVQGQIMLVDKLGTPKLHDMLPKGVTNNRITNGNVTKKTRMTY